MPITPKIITGGEGGAKNFTDLEGTIGLGQITDNFLTEAKLILALRNKINALKSFADITGQLVADQIPDNIISTGNIVNGTIALIDLSQATQNFLLNLDNASGTISNNRFGAGTIHGDIIQTGSLIGNQIEASTIFGDRLVDQTITGSKLAQGSIPAGKLTSFSVATNNIITFAIGENQLGNQVITEAKFNASVVEKLNTRDFIALKNTQTGGSSPFVRYYEFDFQGESGVRSSYFPSVSSDMDVSNIGYAYTHTASPTTYFPEPITLELIEGSGSGSTNDEVLATVTIPITSYKADLDLTTKAELRVLPNTYYYWKMTIPQLAGGPANPKFSFHFHYQNIHD